jgi:hypothetical protein
LILSRFPEEAVVAAVPRQAIGPTAAIHAVVAGAAAQPVVRPEPEDDVVPTEADDDVSLRGAAEDIGPARPDDRRGALEARGWLAGYCSARISLGDDQQGNGQGGNEASSVQEGMDPMSSFISKDPSGSYE